MSERHGPRRAGTAYATHINGWKGALSPLVLGRTGRLFCVFLHISLQSPGAYVQTVAMTSPLPHRLAAARHAAGLTVADLAAAAGVHETTVYRYLSGRLSPTVEIATRLADACNVTVGYLAGDEAVAA